MHVLRLLWAGSFEGMKAALPVTLLAGLGNIVLIGLVNLAAERAALNRSVGLRLVVMYLLAFGVFYVADRMSLRAVNGLVQQRLAALHRRLADKVRTAELVAVERLGRGRIYAIIGQETNHLAQTFPLLVSAAQSLVLLLFCLLYIALLSPASFVVVTGVTAVALLVFALRRSRLTRAMAGMHAQEAAMLDAVGHVTDGFQEIRLGADRNDALFERFRIVVEQLETAVAGIGRTWSGLLMFSNGFLYVLVGIVVFVLPIFFAGTTDVIYKIVAIAIFAVGPVTGVTAVAPLFDRANIGLRHVFDLEQQLDEGRTAPADGPAPDFTWFRQIALKGAAFNHGSFRLGPLDLVLNRGEVLFVNGGNGSGKSTMMKLLCGLYEPVAGEIKVDGVPVGRGAMSSYRSLFSAVFTDFHLFPRPYGIEHVDPAEVAALLRRWGLDGKVSFADGAFSTQTLSTGQRKRLAMVVALLEDRPILLLDEWAADQDAHHRHLFYTELLPELRRRGKTIVAATHDDRYWGMCDRLVTLDLGRIVPPILLLPAR